MGCLRTRQGKIFLPKGKQQLEPREKWVLRNFIILKEIHIDESNGLYCGPGSSVGIATGYGLDGPGIESRCGQDIPPVQTGPGAHPASSTMGTEVFPGGKVRPGPDADPSPPSSAKVLEE